MPKASLHLCHMLILSGKASIRPTIQCGQPPCQTKTLLPGLTQVTSQKLRSKDRSLFGQSQILYYVEIQKKECQPWAGVCEKAVGHECVQ